MSKFSERVHAELDSGRLSLNDDANMLLDFGLQDRIGALLSACYEKLWLIPALAAVSRRPPSTDPEELLAQFCAGGTDGQGIFGSASTLRGAAAAAARRGCVERIVRLIALLDVGASRVLLPTHPAPLCADSPCRSTERLLQQLWRLVGAKEGDVVIHLRRLGLDLRHSQPKHAAKPTPVPLSAAKFLAPATLLSGEVLARLLDQYDHSIAVTLRGALATSTGGEHVGRQNATAVLSALSTCGVKTEGVVDARALASTTVGVRGGVARDGGGGAAPAPRARGGGARRV